MDEFSTLLQEIQFSERFRGYDPEEVDTYMHAVAKAAAQMQGRLSELQQRVAAAESRMGKGVTEPGTEETLTRTLLLAQRTADAAIAEAEAEATRLTAEAENHRDTVVADAEERSAVLLSAAQSQASSVMADADSAASTRLRDAQDRSARILAEAEVERRRILAEAESEAAAAAIADRDRLLAEVEELETRRSTLRLDIDGLDRQVSDQRSQLQRSLVALRSLIEDPANFGLIDRPRAPAEPVTSSFELESDADKVSVIEAEHDEFDVPSWGAEDDESDVARTELDPIAEEFETAAPEAQSDRVAETPVIDDYLHPGNTVETSEAVASDAADDTPVDVEMADYDTPVDVEMADYDTPVDAETADDIEIDLDADDELQIDVDVVDDVDIDLVATEAAEHEIDLPGEEPIDAEIVGETGPMPGRGSGGGDGGSVMESDVRTAPPRFITAADLDDDTTAEPVSSDDIEIVDLQTDLQTDVDEVNEDSSQVADPEPEAPMAPAVTLIDFDEFESQPVTQPVPVVEPEHPSLFGAEPTAPAADDQFLAQLRQAVSSDDQPLSDSDDDDALSAFFDSDDEERRRGWFGRQR